MVMQVKLFSYDLHNKTFVNLRAGTKLEAETNEGNLLSEIHEVLGNHSLLWQPTPFDCSTLTELQMS